MNSAGVIPVALQMVFNSVNDESSIAMSTACIEGFYLDTRKLGTAARKASRVGVMEAGVAPVDSKAAKPASLFNADRVSSAMANAHCILAKVQFRIPEMMFLPLQSSVLNEQRNLTEVS